MPLLVLFDLAPERLVALALFFGVLLLLFENGRRLCCGCGGLLGLVPLVRHSTADSRQSCEDSQQDLRVDRLQHRVFPLRKVGLPGARFTRRTGVIGGALLLDEDGGSEVFDGSIATFHVGYRHLGSEAGVKRTLGLRLA